MSLEESFVKYNDYKKKCGEQYGVVADNLSVADLPPPYGRGIVWTGEKALKKGQTALFVPMKSFITMHSVKDSIGAKFFEIIKSETKMDEDNILALFLVFERHIGTKSKFATHIAEMPKEYDLPFYWSDEEIARLKGTGLHVVSEAMKKQLEEDYKRIAPLVTRHGSAFNFSGRAGFSIEAYRWAMSSVWSRAMTLNLKGTQTKVIVPFADMLNHDPDCSHRHYIDLAKGGLVVVADAPVLPGEQLCINYGLHASRDMLKLRGFVVPGNSFENVEVQIVMPNSTPGFALKLQALQVAPPDGRIFTAPSVADKSEAGLVTVGDHAFGRFLVFEGTYNYALHRMVSIFRTPEDKMKEFVAQLRKDRMANWSVQNELEVHRELWNAFNDMQEGLASAEETNERSLLLDITNDYVNGMERMKQLALEYQKLKKYKPETFRADDDGETPSIVKKTVDPKSTSEKADADVAAPKELTFSNAGIDTSLRRAQMAAYVVNAERRILTAQMLTLQTGIRDILTMVESFQTSDTSDMPELA